MTVGRAVVTGGAGFSARTCASICWPAAPPWCVWTTSSPAHRPIAEALTTAYRSSHGVDTAIVRIFNTYGPRMRPDDGRAIPTFIRQALSGEPMTVHGDGSQTRSVCYVTDTVDGILRLALSDLPGPVNIGNPAELSVLALARLIRSVAGSGSPIVHCGRPQDDPSVRRRDTALAEKSLGWRPRVGTADGLHRTAEWFARRLAAA